MLRSVHTAALGLGLSLLASTASAIELDVPAYVITHVPSGQVLLAKNADMPIEPASLSKLMTLYLVFEAIKQGDLTMDSEIRVSEKAWRTGGSKMFIEVGKTARLEDMIRGIAAASGNDACVAIAEHMAGSEEGFAQLMTAKARKISMTNTTFKNASGLPADGQVSTARDMAQLALRLQLDFPENYKFFAIPEVTYNGIRQVNRNGLLRADAGFDGMKTGHVEEAGYHLVSSVLRKGTRLISVVMGTTSPKVREAETLKGTGWVLSMYDTLPVVQKGQTIESEVPVDMGTVPTVSLVAGDDVGLFMNRQEKSPVKAEAVYYAPLRAPIKAGTVVGTLRVVNPSGNPIEVPLLASADVPELSLSGRVIARLGHLLGL
jgi:D-alanyl-D-alanine carboxypeptidase (penicillin-binding protein 5/6)